uniref:Uncharacterized protein n=1 Tax=Anguilla anguilla TaxID=7936 RepID=A0A0E9X130_ANGAN
MKVRNTHQTHCIHCWSHTKRVTHPINIHTKVAGLTVCPPVLGHHPF